jgi:hypothetical protein
MKQFLQPTASLDAYQQALAVCDYLRRALSLRAGGPRRRRERFGARAGAP